MKLMGPTVPNRFLSIVEESMSILVDIFGTLQKKKTVLETKFDFFFHLPDQNNRLLVKFSE